MTKPGGTDIPPFSDVLMQITGSYYLIPTIEKYFGRILDAITCELSLVACAVRYECPCGDILSLTHCPNGAEECSRQRVAELSDEIFRKSSAPHKESTHFLFDGSLEAYIIPIRCDFRSFGMLILFNDTSLYVIDDGLADLIGVYVTAACIGNHYIMSRTGVQKKASRSKGDLVISVKRLLEWRIQEISNSLCSQFIPDLNIFQRISDEMEKTIIKTALDQTGMNQSKAARFLGINRNTLRKKIKELGIS